MAWIESHTTLREHPKTKRLCRVLGINRREAIGLLHILWWWVLDFAPEGDLSAYSDEDVADSIDWEGDASELITALTQAGFLDADRRVHDWDAFAEKWIARRRANAERMRLARAGRKVTDSEGAENVRDTQAARATQNGECVGLPDQPTNQPTNRTSPDQPTNQPEYPSPNPSPPAGRGSARPRRRRRDEPADELVTPLTTADRERWAAAVTYLARAIPPVRLDGIVRPLEPIGRAQDGGLLLRAPPTIAQDAVGMIGALARALETVGDEHGQRAAIVK